MGPNPSVCVSAHIHNPLARSFYNDFSNYQSSLPEKLQRSNGNKRLIISFYESMKRTPSSDDTFSLLLTGRDTGSIFVDNYCFKFQISSSLTKLAFRNCGIKELTRISSFIVSLPQLTDIDISDNDINSSFPSFLTTLATHPNLLSISAENCKIQDDSVSSIVDFISFSNKIHTFRVDPLMMSTESKAKLLESLSNNYHLQNVSFHNSIIDYTNQIYQRNTFIAEITQNIVRSPYQRQFKQTRDIFKSIKGREMLNRRAEMKSKAPKNIFNVLDQADQKAKSTVEDTRSCSFRSGQAEMIGRRPKMEDVCVITEIFDGIPLFALFDGHGGREAAEAASRELPGSLGYPLNKASFDSAFRRVHADIRPWCVYVGTTAVVAVVDKQTLKVGSVGDSRCVLSRNGKAHRLTIDHKPDLPEEEQFIRLKGGFVREGRIGGMLAVSRALGDGFFGDTINPCPTYREVELNSDDGFMIIACDGVWDVLEDQEVVDIVAKEITPVEAAKKVRDRAYNLGSMDNISVIVVFLAEAFADA